MYYDTFICVLGQEKLSDLSAKSVLQAEAAVLLRYKPMPDKYYSVTQKNITTWPPSLSTFVLNKVCDLIKKGVYMKDVEESVFNHCGHVVASEKIYNHLRYYRAR
jgi:hypothetical protein